MIEGINLFWLVIVTLIVIMIWLAVPVPTIEAGEMSSENEAMDLAKDVSEGKWRLKRLEPVYFVHYSIREQIGMKAKFYRPADEIMCRVYVPLHHPDYAKINTMDISTNVQFTYTGKVHEDMNPNNPMAYLRIKQFRNPSRRRLRGFILSKIKTLSQNAREF